MPVHPIQKKEIRQLEKAHCEAIVQHDSVALSKLWAVDLTVNSPINDVVKLEAAKYAIRNGLIDYSLFETNLEEIMVFKDFVITMGNKRLKPIRNPYDWENGFLPLYTSRDEKKWRMEVD